MVSGGRGVPIRLVVLLALGVVALSYPGLRVWTGRGHELPPTSWVSVVVLVFMAAGVLVAGLPVRRFLRGQAKKSFNPLRAMRILVLAQAAALTGALVTGWYLAQVLVLSPDLDVASVRGLALKLGALSVGGVLMSIAGLLTQAMCRVDRYGNSGDGNNRNGNSRDDEHDPHHHDPTHHH